MILTQRDIDDFADEYRRFTGDVSSEPVLDEGQFLAWLCNNPQVVIASGYQEFVAGGTSANYRLLVQAAQLDDMKRPLFRSFDGSWIVPSEVNVLDGEPWTGFRLNSLLRIAAEQRELEDAIQRYYDAERPRIAMLPASLEAWKSKIDEESVRSIEPMPSFHEMVESASKYVGNPLLDRTTWVSPKLWTPYRQSAEKDRLESTAWDLIQMIRTGRKDLADLTWRQFEDIVAEVFRAQGMEIHVVDENPQGGRDILARTPALMGHDVLTIAIEVKHRKSVDRPQLDAALHQNKHFPALMLVTSGRFSAGVIKEVAKPENRLRVRLNDGVAIRDMIDTYRLK